MDGERVPLGAALFDPLLEKAFDEPALCQLRASQEERQAPAGGVQLSPPLRHSRHSPFTFRQGQQVK